MLTGMRAKEYRTMGLEATGKRALTRENLCRSFDYNERNNKLVA